MHQTGTHRDEPALTRQYDMEQFLASHPQWRVLKNAQDAAPQDGVLARSAHEVLLALSHRVPSERVFFPAPFDRKELETLFAAPQDGAAMCRFIAEGPEDLEMLEAAAQKAGSKDPVKAGLRIRQTERSADPANPGFPVQKIRKLRRVTVRGCFFCADLTGIHGTQLGRFFRNGYEAAKRMTAALPCAMPYICYEGAASALLSNARQHPETLADCLRSLEIMTMQNETAFYARLFLN